MLHAIILVALAQVAQPAPGPWSEQSMVSPIASLIAWDKGGSQDWGAGIRSPDIDCAATGTSSSASLQCSGASPSFAGTGQTAAGSPWWYRGDSAVRPAIALNGSTDYWDLGDVGDTDSDLAACVGWRNNATGVQSLWGKYAAAGKGWIIYTNTTAVVVEVCKAGPSCTSITLAGANVAGAFTQACFGYDYVADGTSVLRLAVNGVAATAVTNAVGPIANVATTLRLGSDGYDERVNGAIRRGAIWTGADAPTSAAQLAQLVATQNGLAHDKPAGAVASCSRSDSTPCGPFSDAEQFLLGPGYCCIHAPTYQGWASGGAVAGGVEVYGAGANALAESRYVCNGTSFQTGWSPSGAPTTCTAGTTTGPWGTALSGKLTYTASSYAYATAFTATAVPYTLSCWMKANSGSPRPYLAATPDNANFYARGLCPVLTPTWQRCTATGTMGAGSQYMMVGIHSGDAQQNQGVAGTIWVEGCQATPTAYPVPYRATTGTAYAGSASTATTLTVPVALTDPARWAIGLTLLSASATPALYGRPLALGTPYAANTTTLEFHTGGGIYFDVNDGAGTDSLLLAANLWTTPGPHTLLFGKDGPQRLAFDGVWQTLSGTPGPATWSAIPATVTLNQAAATYPVPGLYQRLAQCRRAGGCR